MATFAERLASIADQAERIRINAEDTNPKLAYEAGKAEAAALRELAERYGITSETVAEELAEAEQWVRTLRRVLDRYGAPLARALRDAANAEGYDGLVDLLDRVTTQYENNPPARISKGEMK